MKKLLTTYWLLTISIFTLTVVYLNNGISLKGYWSDKIFFMIWLILTIIVLTKKFKKRWARIYLTGLISIVVLSMLPMMIPFLSLVAFTTANDRETNYIINSKYRLEETFMSVIVPPRVILIKSLGPFEKVIGYTDYEFFINEAVTEKERSILDIEKSFKLKDVHEVEIIDINQIGHNELKFVFKTGSINRLFKK